MSIFNKIFAKPKQWLGKLVHFRELGSYVSIFRPFGDQIYRSDLVRSCIRAISEQTSKANPKSNDARIEKLLTYRPNQFMNGKDFLAKCRNILEVKNTLFVYIVRDDRGRATAFYPVPYETFEAMEYNGDIYIKFTFVSSECREMVAPWKDLAVTRKDYLFSDIAGEDNEAILPTLELISTTNQGVANAVKATSNLRGLLKNTKTMLDSEDIKKQRDQFVADYMNLENAGGIASLDPTQEFIPITMNPTVTTWEQSREFRENVYRYYGICEDIVMSRADESVMESFYSSRIEPFLVAFSLELTSKVFTERELGFGAYIQFESNRLQFASNNTKLALVQLVDRGAMTPNEWRAVFNLAPVEGGDVPIRRLDTAPVDEAPAEEEENED